MTIKVHRIGKSVTLYNGDCLRVLKSLKHFPNDSIHCCITSPPYYQLRDYGTGTWEGGGSSCEHVVGNQVPDSKNTQAIKSGIRQGVDATICKLCGANRVDKQIGIEQDFNDYIANLVKVFTEVKRVLRPDGQLWLNLGDSYSGSSKGRNTNGTFNENNSPKQHSNTGRASGVLNKTPSILPAKNLIGIPWRVALALQESGWILRSDIIWCLSGRTWLYVRSQKGAMPMMIKDLARLDPATVKLWNGKKWTQLLGVSKRQRKGNVGMVELVLRSGERISCTPTHKFPTRRGLLAVSEMVVGDILQSCLLPEPAKVRDCVIDEDAAWFAGLYIAEGSKSGPVIQLSGHALETERWDRIQKIAHKFGGSCAITVTNNSQNIRVYGVVLNAILDLLVWGHDAHDKGFTVKVWQYSNKFIAAMLDGYLSGDGSKDGARWRLTFCRNYKLERDIRTACARLGYKLTLNRTMGEFKGRPLPQFRGEIRTYTSGHWNEKNRNEIMQIVQAPVCKYVYDIGVKDKPHVFALASGILTHNSKPNAMPSAVTDRPSTNHEYLFLLVKKPRYYYDHEAVKVKSLTTDTDRVNLRTVWSIPNHGTAEEHYAAFPEKIVQNCLFAGTSEQGCCGVCGAPMLRTVSKTTLKRNQLPKDHEDYRPNVYAKKYTKENQNTKGLAQARTYVETTGWERSCTCEDFFIDQSIVLDPFNGSGTTGLVTIKHNRKYIGVELSEKFTDITLRRLKPIASQPRLFNK